MTITTFTDVANWVVHYAATPVVTVVLAVVVGQRLVARWGVWQKRRELALNATKDFYRSYGEFFAVWKLWNYSRAKLEAACPTDCRWKLLERAVAAEAQVESLLVRLAAERPLNDKECEDAGKLRQAFQTLREAIRDGKQIPWVGDEVSEYKALKALSCHVAHMIATSHERKSPSREEAWRSLKTITSNKWESHWWVGWWTQG